jgi:hypothetical protein
LAPLAVAELIIYLLPKPEDPVVMESERLAGVVIQSEDEEQQKIDEDPVVSTYNTIHGLDPPFFPMTNDNNKPSSYLGINIISCILSDLITTVTTFTFSWEFM